MNEQIHNLVEEILRLADEKTMDEGEQDGGWDSREDMRCEPEWSEYVMRYAGEAIAELAEHIGGYFTPEGPDSAARQVWFGEDFNYSRPDEIGHWNAAFLYNASEGMISLIRSTAYAFARRGWLPPHAVGKNHSDFDPEKGGSLA